MVGLSFFIPESLNTSPLSALWPSGHLHPGLTVLGAGSETFQPCEQGMSLEKERCCLALGTAVAGSVPAFYYGLDHNVGSWHFLNIKFLWRFGNSYLNICSVFQSTEQAHVYARPVALCCVL